MWLRPRILSPPFGNRLRLNRVPPPQFAMPLPRDHRVNHGGDHENGNPAPSPALCSSPRSLLRHLVDRPRCIPMTLPPSAGELHDSRRTIPLGSPRRSPDTMLFYRPLKPLKALPLLERQGASKAPEIVAEGMLDATERFPPQLGESAYGRFDIPRKQRLIAESSKWRIGLGQDSGSGHRPCELSALVAAQHHWANTEPAADVNCSGNFPCCSGEPVKDRHARPRCPLDRV